MPNVRKSNEGGAGNIHYLFSDHLGSSSVLTDANGNYSSDDRALYTPFGELRGNAPAFLGYKPTTDTSHAASIAHL